MAQSLSKIDMSSVEMAKLNSLFSDLGIDTVTVFAGMAPAWCRHATTLRR